MDVKVETSGAVATVTINRPESLNALLPETQYALIDAFTGLTADPEIGAIVLTGAGRAFCAGGDIRAMSAPKTETIEAQTADLRRREEIVAIIRQAPQVVVAAINGAAMGAGLAIALACDIRMAAVSAKFGAVHARIGLTGDFAISWLLHTEVGASHARRMLLGAEILDASAAADIGLVHSLHADAELLEAAGARARRFAEGPREAYAMIKQNLFEAPGLTLSGSLDKEAERLVLAKQTEDHATAIAAFLARSKG